METHRLTAVGFLAADGKAGYTIATYGNATGTAYMGLASAAAMELWENAKGRQ